MKIIFNINFNKTNAQIFLFNRYIIFGLLTTMLLILVDGYLDLKFINYIFPMFILIFIILLITSFFINTNESYFNGTLSIEKDLITLEDKSNNFIETILINDIDCIKIYLLDVKGKRGLSFATSSGLNYFKIITYNEKKTYLFKIFNEKQMINIKNQFSQVENIQIVIKELRI